MQVCYSQQQYILFVGNLPYDLSADKFKDLFTEYGAIERYFLVRSEESGHSKGYGFVEFLEKESADKAKKEANIELCERKLRIDYANFGLFDYKDLHSTTLFVDKFSPDTSSKDLEDLFASECKILFCQVCNIIFIFYFKAIIDQ